MYLERDAHRNHAHLYSTLQSNCKTPINYTLCIMYWSALSVVDALEGRVVCQSCLLFTPPGFSLSPHEFGFTTCIISFATVLLNSGCKIPLESWLPAVWPAFCWFFYNYYACDGYYSNCMGYLYKIHFFTPQDHLKWASDGKKVIKKDDFTHSTLYLISCGW